VTGGFLLNKKQPLPWEEEGGLFLMKTLAAVSKPCLEKYRQVFMKEL
jgi:hypothetical protein